MFINNDDSFRYKLGDTPETDTISGNKRLNAKYDIAFQEIALRFTELLELYKCYSTRVRTDFR